MTRLRMLRHVVPIGAALATVLGVRTPTAQADGGQPLATCVEWDCTGSICNRRLMSCTCYATAEEASQHMTGQYSAYGSATQMQSKLVARCADDEEAGWNLCCTAGRGAVLCACETYQSSVSCNEVAEGRGAPVSTCEGAKAGAAAVSRSTDVAPPRSPDRPTPPTESAEQRRRREPRERADEAARAEAERRTRQAREQELVAFFKPGGKPSTSRPSRPVLAGIAALRNACLAGSAAACSALPAALAGKLPPVSSIPNAADVEAKRRACPLWNGEYDVFDYMAHSLDWNHAVIESIAQDDGWPAAQTQIANGISDPSVNAWQQHRTDFEAFARWAAQVLAGCEGLLAACGGVPAAIDVGPMSVACTRASEQGCFDAIAAQITNAERLDKFAVCAQAFVREYRRLN